MEASAGACPAPDVARPRSSTMSASQARSDAFQCSSTSSLASGATNTPRNELHHARMISRAIAAAARLSQALPCAATGFCRTRSK